MRQVFLLGVAIAALAGCDGAEATRGDSAGVASASSSVANGPEAIRRVRLIEHFADVSLGDSAYQYRAVVERNNERLDTMAVNVVSVADTNVARVVNGRVLPMAVGQTSAQIDVAPGTRLRGVVHVTERVFSDSVWLAPGEVRAWELRPSWYRITVDAKASPGAPQPLELAADLICVPDSRGPKETIVCRVRQNTRILLRHTGAGRLQRREVAVVTILRTPR